jgi:hypothetical protein
MREAASTEFLPLVRTRKQTEGGLVDMLLSSRRLLVVVFMLVIFTVATRPITDPDFWWHLKTGQYLVETGSIPHTDIFSTVRFGSEWITHEWLSEIFIYSIYRALGYGGLIIAFSAIITAAFWIAYRRFTKLARHPYVSGFALILGALTTVPIWGVRPQMFSFLFASIYVVVLDDYVREEKRHSLWWLVPLMILWVNMHAGFAVGLALILLTVAGLALEGILAREESLTIIWRRVRPLLEVGMICGAAVLLNPNGARMYLYPFETLRSQAMMKYIDEWLSPNFHELTFQPFLVLIFATFSMLALSSKRVRLLNMVLLLATAAAALRSARNLPFFVLIAMPLLAEHSWNWITSHRWGQWLTRPEKREGGSQAMLKIALNLALLVALPVIVAAVRVHHSLAKQPAAEAKGFPSAAVEFLRAQKPPQPLFNEYGWGGYLIWKLYPDYRVYIDGRADVYGDAFMEEFLLAQAGATGWRGPLDKYGVRTVLVKPDVALASLLRLDTGWQKVFEDPQAVIFVRR